MTNSVTTDHIGKWWQTGSKSEPLICVYCGSQTTGTEDDEHILPESLGSKGTLYKGAVCNRCNHGLGKNVDEELFREPLIASGQVAQETEGKKGVRSSIRNVRKEDDTTKVEGGNSGRDHEFHVARAIAKCGVNIFTHHFGSELVREKFPDLIAYVVQPKNRQDIWPYAAAFAPLGGFGVGFGIETVKTPDEPYPLFVILSASGILASVPHRDSHDAAETAHDHILSLLAEGEAQRGEKVVSMTYVAQGST